MARQPLGQHFLADPGWRRKILASLPRVGNETWIEIGAGHGEMTQHLAGEGRRVVAIETDAVLAKNLTACGQMDPANWTGVEIVPADALTVDFGRLAPGKFRVYGNLPYYITSPILHHLFEWADHIQSMHVVVQLEVAARIIARPGRREYGYLSTLCQFYAKPEIVLRIPPGAFRPPPRVASALVCMTMPGERPSLHVSDDKQFLEFLHVCFRQKRKTLRNNLRAIARDPCIHATLAACGLQAEARAEQLSLHQFADVFRRLSQRDATP
jgi:16S rRNA (adenine1518-N6/adenine1519-N6)-dimethyltransferase